MGKYQGYEKYKDSGVKWLGEIPEHWEAVRLKHITHKIIDGAHFTPTYVTALSDGVPIIISTIQKFPFITKAIATLAKKGKTIDITTKDKRFAVIVDEAHGSQTGETATELRKILNKDGIESAIAHIRYCLDL